MRKALVVGLIALFLLPASGSGARAPETGGTVFAGGGTNLSNGIFFPGTVVYEDGEYQGLPPLQLEQGTDLEFVNLDASIVTNGHQIVSFKRRKGRPVFRSERVDGPDRTLVITSHLKPGLYPYFCATHFGMYGRIEIVKE